MANPNTTQNSFSTILANFIRLQNNALESLQKVQQATVSQADTVTVTVANENGTKKTYTIPSFGYLKGSIERIDNTISKMLGFDGSEAYIRLPDGTFKRIYQSINLVNPTPIGNVAVPSKFIAENNWFFESLYTPALKVSFDVTPFIAQRESKIFVKRMILNLDTSSKVTYYQTNINGRNDIDYVSFLAELQSQTINYFLDEGIVDLPMSIVRYTGEFFVVNTETRTVSNPDGTSSSKVWYLFDKQSYTDNLLLTKDTLELRVGDKLLKAQSLYEIIEIGSDKWIRVKRINGYDPFVIGEPVNFYSETFSPKIANVGIGFNEYNVIFFKTVNDEDNLISTTFSPGVSFYTNDLSTDTTGGAVSMKQFYQSNVLDFGNILMTAAKEGKISAIDGLTPDAPSLTAANFSVVQINDHKLDQSQITSIRKKQADKIKLSSEIDQLDAYINKLKTTLNSQKFNSETDRRGAKNKLDSAIRERNSKTSLYASIVNELAVISQQKPAALDTPKYRIRGFFDIPNPKQSDKTGSQSIIQFYTYYRYVRPDGSQSNVKQYDFIDQNGQRKKGSYSNLIEIKSDIRKKVYDIGTGKYVWAKEDIANPDAVNINQIDIPISKGEKVEFYIVSVSEAGWPDNPLLSAPSNTISIDFPSDLATEDEATIALNQAAQDSVRVQLENDLQSQGLDVHLSSSFNVVDKYYAHDSDVISSNFYTPEGNVISLYEKLKELQTRILQLENQVNRVRGALSVFIIDPATNTKTPVKESTVIQLFAGYYLDFVSLLPTNSRRGAIINKTYQIAIQNNEATPLQLISRFPGGIGGIIPTTLSSTELPTFKNTSPYKKDTLFVTTPDTDYNSFRLYDQTPIVQTSMGRQDTNNANKFATAFYQSGQSTGQYIYSRYKDVGLVNALYQSPPSGTKRYLVPTTPVSDTKPLADNALWVWDGTFDVNGTPNNGNTTWGKFSDFCVHTDCPELNLGRVNVNKSFNDFQVPRVTINTATGFPLAPESVTTFRHSFGFNDVVETISGYTKQLNYRQAFLQNDKSTGDENFYGKTYTGVLDEYPDKFGFTDDDRYLIGTKTCGSYLFLGPSTYNQLNVNGTDARATYNVNFGDASAIIIPVIFQFRMEDYYGGPGGAGAGIVGGYSTAAGWVAPTNLTYGKRIGVDIYSDDASVFSFDIQVGAIYKKTSISQVVASAVPTETKEVENITYTKDTIKTLNTGG